MTGICAVLQHSLTRATRNPFFDVHAVRLALRHSALQHSV
jgi:hypothetical protein